MRGGLPYSDRYVAAGLTIDTEAFQAANATRALLKQIPRLDGVFCYNDPLAIGVMNTILEADYVFLRTSR
jgi:LacI family transcriptional regulator